MAEQPDWSKLVADLGNAMKESGYILGAQAAMGWMFRGDMDKARDALAKLPADQLRTGAELTDDEALGVGDELEVAAFLDEAVSFMMRPTTRSTATPPMMAGQNHRGFGFFGGGAG